jgi:hypothetical protein
MSFESKSLNNNLVEMRILKVLFIASRRNFFCFLSVVIIIALARFSCFSEPS